MPSAISLEYRQYYAHPRNAFWKILAEFTGMDETLEYAQRVKKLKSTNIALWDVLKHCERKGSLDSNIKRTSEVANNIPELLEKKPSIRAVFFNGKKAEHAFTQHILPALSTTQLSTIHRVTLPSSSPANAHLSSKEKMVLWHKHLRAYCPRRGDC